MYGEVRDVLVGVSDLESSVIVLGQQFVPDVPIFQTPVVVLLLLVVFVAVAELAVFSQCVVEEIYPGLAELYGLVVRGIDGGCLVFGFQTPVGWHRRPSRRGDWGTCMPCPRSVWGAVVPPDTGLSPSPDPPQSQRRWWQSP